MHLFDPAWCDLLVSTCDREDAALGDVVVEVQFTGAPRGRGRVTFVVEGGRLSSCAPQRCDEADLHLKTTWDDAWAMLRGDLDPNVAYMTGDLKTDGPTGPLLALLSVLRQPAAVAARTELAGQTEPDAD